MKKTLQLLKHWGALLRGFLPSALPVGVTAFDRFCVRIFETYGLPDLPSYRNSVATLVMHLGPTVHKKPLRYFCAALKKSMANQVAFEVIQSIRDQEKKDQKQKEALGAKPDASLQN